MAFKPFPFTLKRLSREYNFSLKKTVVVGDQLLKDVFLANWVRSYSVLVKPIDKSSNYIDVVQRRFENFLLKSFSISIPFKL